MTKTKVYIEESCVLVPESIVATETQPSIEERLVNIEAIVAYNQLQTEYFVILSEFSFM